MSHQARATLWAVLGIGTLPPLIWALTSGRWITAGVFVVIATWCRVRFQCHIDQENPE
jgi:hypothetical protein